MDQNITHKGVMLWEYFTMLPVFSCLLCHLMFCTVQDVDKCLSAPHVHDTAPVLNPKSIIFC